MAASSKKDLSASASAQNARLTSCRHGTAQTVIDMGPCPKLSGEKDYVVGHQMPAFQGEAVGYASVPHSGGRSGDHHATDFMPIATARQPPEILATFDAIAGNSKYPATHESATKGLKVQRTRYDPSTGEGEATHEQMVSSLAVPMSYPDKGWKPSSAWDKSANQCILIMILMHKKVVNLQALLALELMIVYILRHLEFQ